MSKYNNMKTILINEISEEERMQAYHEWAEGSKELERLLAEFNGQRGILTMGSDLHQSIYLDFHPDNRREDMIKIFAEVLKMKRSSVSVCGGPANPYSGESWDLDSYTICFFEPYKQLSEDNYRRIRESVGKGTQHSKEEAVASRVVDIMEAIRGKYSEFSLAVKHKNGKYEILCHSRLLSYEEQKRLFEAEGFVPMDRGGFGFSSDSLDKVDEMLSKVLGELQKAKYPNQIMDTSEHLSYSERRQRGISEASWFLSMKQKMTPEEFRRYVEEQRAERDASEPKREEPEMTYKKIGERDCNYIEIERDGKKTKVYIVNVVNGEAILPYALAVPEDIKNGSQMIVESVNTSGRIDTMDSLHDTIIRNLDISSGSAPIVVPLLPDGREVDYQQLSLEAVRDFRTDLKVKSCIEDAMDFARELCPGIQLQDKVVLSGYSASATFAQRFALAHPEIVDKCVTGGAAGAIPVPTKELGYPLGIRDYEQLFGKEFNEEAYRKIQFAYYVGEYEAERPGFWDRNGREIRKDIRDRIVNVGDVEMPMADQSYRGKSVSPEEGKKQRRIFGEELNERFIRTLKQLVEMGYFVTAKIYSNIGHSHFWDKRSNPNYETVLRDVQAFLETGKTFERDETSAQEIDMTAQRDREAYAREAEKRLKNPDH